MEIVGLDSYRDGGTMEIKTTDNVVYCIDNRIRSTTKGSIFLGYPKRDNNNIIKKQSEVREELIKAIENYSADEDFFDWRPKLKELLKYE